MVCGTNSLAQASFGFGQSDRQIRYRMPPTMWNKLLSSNSGFLNEKNPTKDETDRKLFKNSEQYFDFQNLTSIEMKYRKRGFRSFLTAQSFHSTKQGVFGKGMSVDPR